MPLFFICENTSVGIWDCFFTHWEVTILMTEEGKQTSCKSTKNTSWTEGHTTLLSLRAFPEFLSQLDSPWSTSASQTTNTMSLWDCLIDKSDISHMEIFEYISLWNKDIWEVLLYQGEIFHLCLLPNINEIYSYLIMPVPFQIRVPLTSQAPFIFILGF